MKNSHDLIMELLSSLYYVIYNKAQKWNVIKLKGFYIHKKVCKHFG